MPTLAAPVQLISSTTLDPNNPIEAPEQFLQTGDVQISTGGSAFVNIATLPTASEENNTDLVIQLSDAEVAEDYEIRFHDPDGVWVDINIDVTFPAPVEPPVEPLTPDQVAEGVGFIGANGVTMVGTLVADCPSQFSVCLQNNDGNPIRGALIFASTDQAGADIVDVTISDQDGNAQFTGLEIGTYYTTTEINRQTVDVRPFEVKN